MKISFGEYAPGEYAPHLYNITRREFYANLKELASHITDELKVAPLNRLTEYCQRYIESSDYPQQQFEAYRQSLRAWAASYRLDAKHWENKSEQLIHLASEDVWNQLDLVLREQYEKSYSSHSRNHKLATLVHLFPFNDPRRKQTGSPEQNECIQEFPEFTFEDEGWDIFKETRLDVTKRIRGEFNRELQKYLEAMETLANNKHLSAIPRRKPQVGRWPFEWLIRVHVERWPKNKIARDSKVHRNAVQKSIPIEANLIGLVQCEEQVCCH